MSKKLFLVIVVGITTCFFNKVFNYGVNPYQVAQFFRWLYELSIYLKFLKDKNHTDKRPVVLNIGLLSFIYLSK